MVVKSHSLKLKHLDLCSGIGGFALGLQNTGHFETIAFCEIEPFCQKVLKQQFPYTTIYNDIKELKPNDNQLRPDIITAGFPWQVIPDTNRNICVIKTQIKRKIIKNKRSDKIILCLHNKDIGQIMPHTNPIGPAWPS